MSEKEPQEVVIEITEEDLRDKTEEEKRAEEEAAKRKKRKKIITIATVVVVVIVAYIGFCVWHDTPTFCNTVCHTPMNYYVETYESNDTTMLASTHAKSGVSCISCHPATVDRQITQAMEEITGNYEFDESTQQLVNHTDQYGTAKLCMKSGCHDITLDELKSKTSNRTWNPHDFGPHDVYNCGDCHRNHTQSVMVCSECHEEASENLAYGWTCVPYSDSLEGNSK